MSASKTTSSKKAKKSTLFTICLIIIFVSIGMSILLFKDFYRKAKASCADTFSRAYEDTKQNTYNQFYSTAYDYYEKKNHVSNNATLTIGNIKEENSLEVLSVSDSWVMISEPDKDVDRTTRWVEFSATGVYTIDMSVSEFIIDNNNNFVIVKLKTPQLNHIALDTNSKAYLFKYEKGFMKLNGNYDAGVRLMLEDRARALDVLTKQLEENNTNLVRAKASAITLIRSLIRNVNPDLNLKDEDIQVEFI